MFTATKFNTVEDKEKFFKHFQRFILKGMPATLFYRGFYNQLTFCFGHIAHYNKRGFYATWFGTEYLKLKFLEHTLQAQVFGDPEYTFSDVEREIQGWLRNTELVHEYQVKIAAEQKEERRATFNELQKEFDPS